MNCLRHRSIMQSVGDRRRPRIRLWGETHLGKRFNLLLQENCSTAVPRWSVTFTHIYNSADERPKLYQQVEENGVWGERCIYPV